LTHNNLKIVYCDKSTIPFYLRSCTISNRRSSREKLFSWLKRLKSLLTMGIDRLFSLAISHINSEMFNQDDLKIIFGILALQKNRQLDFTL